MTDRNEIKGILVTFFREATKDDYIEALNNAEDELIALMEASKISSNGMLKVTSDSKENKKKSEVAVCRCFEPVKLIDVFDNFRCGWCNGIIK